MRQARAPQESHKLAGKGVDPLLERFEGAFSTDGLAQQDDNEIEGVIVPQGRACEAHGVRQNGEHATVLEILSDEGAFPKPGRCGRNRRRRGLDWDRHICDTDPRASLSAKHFAASMIRRLIALPFFVQLPSRCATRGSLCPESSSVRASKSAPSTMSCI
jgi:hypothetical protein